MFWNNGEREVKMVDFIISYKLLRVRWLYQAFSLVSSFMSANRYEACNFARFMYLNVAKILSEQGGKIIALDRTFKENNRFKTNFTLQMKDVGREFKTI